MTKYNGDSDVSGDAGGDSRHGSSAGSRQTLAANAPTTSFWRHVRHFVGGCIAGGVDSESPPPGDGHAGSWHDRKPDVEPRDFGGGDALGLSKQCSSPSSGHRWRDDKTEVDSMPLVAPPSTPTLTTTATLHRCVCTLCSRLLSFVDLIPGLYR